MSRASKLDGNRVIIGGESGDCVAIMPDTAEKILPFGGEFIVMTGVKNGVGNRNIFRVSAEGRIVWQVQDPFEFRNIKSDRSAAFTYIGIDEHGKLIGNSWHGFNYDIDFETGLLSNPVFTK